ncbi:MAG: hypothetical protein HQM10_18930 [Candidatus Riflebacteria bacterium]|nr:hypothetical protein [Candidatus Riflebacteria bacterium]
MLSAESLSEAQALLAKYEYPKALDVFHKVEKDSKPDVKLKKEDLSVDIVKKAMAGLKAKDKFNHLH